MNKSTSLLIIILILMIAGCSSTKSSPVIPENPQTDINLPSTELNADESSHSILGTWTLSINHETLEATVKQNRTLNAHHNVTGMIPDPLITINSWDPIEEIADVDITLENPLFYFNAFDVRLIIYTDDVKHMLLNEDNWTRLWDIPGGQIANPFKAYAKDEPRRMFMGESSHTENFQIKCPDSDFNIQFAVDASYPGNCEEPYEITNFHQSFLGVDVGANAYVAVDVLHWQNDVSEVYLVCPEVTGESEIPFEYVSSNKWRLNLTNNTGASVGWYGAWIYAISPGLDNLEMIHRIKITVSPGAGIPSDPQIVGEIYLMQEKCHSVDVYDGLAVIFCKNHLLFIDINDPLDPEIVSTHSFGRPYAYYNPFTYVIDDLLVVIVNEQYVIFDISDLKNPVNVYDVEFNYQFITTTIRDNILYAGSTYYSHEFKIFDLSDPFNLIELGSINMGLRIVDVEVKDDYAYMTIGSSGNDTLEVVDISDLVNPQSVVSLDVGSYLINIEIYDDYLYLDSINKIYVIDISNPLSPDVIGSFPSPAIANDLEIYDSYLYAARDLTSGPSHLAIYDLSNPEMPINISTIEMYNPVDMDFSGDYAFIAESEMGLRVIDISDPSIPQFVSHLSPIKELEDIAVNNEYAYVATTGMTNCGMQIFDITDPSSPDSLSAFNGIESEKIEIDGDYVFIFGSISSNDYLVSCNVQDPLSPYLVSLSEASHYPIDLAFEGDTAIAACSYYLDSWSYPGAIYRYNVSDPTGINRTGSIETDPFRPYSVAISRDYAYVSMALSGLMVIDISDPETIEIAATIDPFPLGYLASQGSYLYHVWADFSVYDISDPVDPRIIASINSLTSPNVVVSGNYAYISNAPNDHGRLMTIDISDPANPYIFSTVNLHEGAIARRLKIYDNYCYIIAYYRNVGYPAIYIIKLW